MGLGSRLSKRIETDLLQRFVWIEFGLSCIASNVTVIVYSFFAFYGDPTFIIYLLSISVGMLIGMEIPIVIRLNEQFQSLKVNISSALENDYYGSLAGGVFFAFVGLPYLGLTYTPLILGTLNFLVAITLIVIIWTEVPQINRKKFILSGASVVAILSFTAFFSNIIVQWGDKIRYNDRVVYSEQTRYQKIVLTYGDGDYWLFLNGHQQLCTIDEALYHEPLVHPVVQLHGKPLKVLVLGGGDGAAVRELLKYPVIEAITLVDLDPGMTNLGMTHPVLLEINNNSLNHPKVQVINLDGFTYLDKSGEKFDIIIADFPDPRTVDLGRLYSLEFYWLCYDALTESGYFVTQAGSPYYAEQAFDCIEKTMISAGFKTLPLHNQVMTLGEWGWIIGSKDQSVNMKTLLQSKSLNGLNTQWLNVEALTLLSSFGKEVFEQDYEEPKVNRLHDPVLYRYYLNGRWDLY